MLPAVDLPALVIHGSADTICPAGVAHYLVERIADARLMVFDGAGHAPFLSRPDEFNAIVREFLQEVYGRN
jgi:pimeloyl-[acyl-carrier protein] methyl ester esterase